MSSANTKTGQEPGRSFVPLVALLVMLPVIWVKFRLPKTDLPGTQDDMTVAETVAPNG